MGGFGESSRFVAGGGRSDEQRRAATSSDRQRQAATGGQIADVHASDKETLEGE